MTNQPAAKRAPLLFRDLSLRFAHYNQQDGSFKVWIEGEAPGGAMRPDEAVTRTYDPTLFWKDPSLGVGGLLGKIDRRSSTLTKEDLFKLGAMLADLALPTDKIRPLFEKSEVAVQQAGEGLRLRLRIDAAQLAQLPWEFMALPQSPGGPQDTDFLALRGEISIVRTDTVASAARPLPNRKPHVIGVLARPEDQDRLKVESDQKALSIAVQAFNQTAGEELIHVTWVEKPATRTNLVNAVAGGADVFQYSGHATFELNQEGKLILETEEVESDPYPAGQLAQLLRSAGVRLVVLSACETGRRNGQNLWGGVAPALTREKIPAVLANQFDILDTNAVLVAAYIYPRLLSGYTLDEALFEARQAIYQANGLEGRDWGAPVLYLQDESGVLFPIPERGASDEAVGQGPFVRVARTLDRVAGKAIEAKIKEMNGGRLVVESRINVVEQGAEAIGVEIDKLGRKS